MLVPRASLLGARDIIEEDNIDTVRKLVKSGDWEIAFVPSAGHYVMMSRVAEEEMILGFKTTSSDTEATELVVSGKWRKVAVGVVQNSSMVDGQVMHRGGALFILERIKP